MKLRKKEIIITMSFGLMSLGLFSGGLVTLNNNSNNITNTKSIDSKIEETNSNSSLWFKENNITIIDISAGHDHSLALSNTGDVYSFGLNENGQLGHGDEDDRSSPTKIEVYEDAIGLVEDVTITNILAGNNHSLALSDTGEVYSFGLNENGQLGHGNKSEISTPTKIEVYEDATGPVEDITIIDISSGGSHSLVISDTDDVYSFGLNENGQLGHGDEDNRSTPTKIEALDDLTITNILAGNNHSLVLSNLGDVYSFGSGEYNQLGHGNTNDKLIPTKIEVYEDETGPIEDITITHISAAYKHSLVLSDTGDVYSFGSNSYGELGHGNTSTKLIPTKIEEYEDLTGPIEEDITITHISAGYNHSLVLSNAGEIYSFGLNVYAQLGHRDPENKLTPTKIPEYENKLGLIDDIKITNISAAETHSLALSDKGEVYSFGISSNGELGHGDKSKKFIPTKIESLSPTQPPSPTPETNLPLIIGLSVGIPLGLALIPLTYFGYKYWIKK